ncbi:MAG: hypothetical protein K2N95_15665 [Lachnospiraceae bacterium]|nr:hypothetical protein [Lachnospiraceae bacterium]
MVVKRGRGIYQISGMLFPMQIVVACELKKSAHIWLKSLTRNLNMEDAEDLLNHCDRLRTDDVEYSRAKSVVNLVSDVNEELFKQITAGGEKMSDELKYMVLPELKEKDEQLAKARKEIASSKAELESSKAVIASKDAELESSKAVIASKDAELESSKAVIASKDAEIERLRRELEASRAANA